MQNIHLKPILVSILLLCTGGLLIFFIYQNWINEEVSLDNSVVAEVQQIDETPDLTSIIHETKKSVMLIEGQTEEETITGSGFLYNEKGDIVTNAHVVRDADMINIRMANARVYPAALVGISEETDIALVRVPQLAGQVPLEIADETAEIGDDIIALGSPHGFQNTVTLGIISGTERNFTVDGYNYQNVHQISARITDGNSGGPLIDRQSGKVIGINSVGTKDGTLGFSIPINNVIAQLKEWSQDTENDQLDFAGTKNILEKNDSEQLKSDAAYLVEYFFDSLDSRDYVEAYTTLGSDIQTATDYPEFRKDYVQIDELTYDEMTTSMQEDTRVEATARVTIKSKQPKKESLTTNHYTYRFVIGYENEQLKLLKLDRESID